MRLTPEQAARLDADAVNTIAAMPNIVGFFRGEKMPFSRCSTGNTHAWRCRVLDLLDEVRALRERAERAVSQRRVLELACRDAETMDAELDAALQRWLTNRGEGEHIQVARAIIEARKTIAGLKSERDAALARADCEDGKDGGR